jgi:tRNA 2-thiouridine synthesizing protein E
MVPSRNQDRIMISKGGTAMKTFKYKDNSYEVDSDDFLLNPDRWDENFAEGMAKENQIANGLTKDHWSVISFIRNTFLESGRCPMVYEAYKNCGFNLNKLKKLFPTGYLRGACKISGVTYKDGYLEPVYFPHTTENIELLYAKKTYRIDVHGFLVEPGEWDHYYAACRAYDMKIPQLTDKHWGIIRFLRDYYEKNRAVPTVFETCEQNQIDLEDLERLFPDGYHRGAVKIAGLRAIYK